MTRHLHPRFQPLGGGQKNQAEVFLSSKLHFLTYFDIKTLRNILKISIN